MRVLRVILLASLIFTLAGSAFAKNDKGGGKGKESGKTAEAPELNFNVPLRYELIIVAGAGAVLLERRRRRRAVSSNQ